ncbi:HAD-IB family hydrolase [Patescibacteria group bacterium]|nr:HAD-IB family hydrolase [Patescibacteria group bacterium]
MSSCPRLAVFDIDGTLYRRSLMIDLIEHLMQLQRIMPSYFIESRALQKRWEERETGYNTYVHAMVREWEQKALGGLAEAEVVDAARRILTETQKRVYVFTRELLGALQESGYTCVALSHSPKQIVDVFAQVWKFDLAFGTEWVIDPTGRFSRNQKDAVRHGIDKGRTFDEVVEALEAELDESVAIGDSLDDIPMLERVKYPIAFNPEQALLNAIRPRGVPAVFERKNVMFAIRTEPERFAEGASDAFLLRETPYTAILPPAVAIRLQERLTAWQRGQETEFRV